MTLQEIKSAVAAGKTVHWKTPAYSVIRDSEDYKIKCMNGHCIFLTWADNVTMNGKPEDFYVA